MRKRTRFRGNEQGFTLIELMATLVILALIIAIAVPAIGKLVAQAGSSADKSSISLMERAGEMAYIDNLKTDDAAPKNSKLPASITEKDVYMIPTLIEKGYLKLDDASKFNKPENYVKKVNKSGKFIYMGKGSDGKPVETPDDVAACTRDGAYTAATTFDMKVVERNANYQTLHMDQDGNYIAAGPFGGDYKYPRYGFVFDKYDKNMKLIATNVQEYNNNNEAGSPWYTGYLFDSVPLDSGSVFLKDGNVIVTTSRDMEQLTTSDIQGSSSFDLRAIEKRTGGGYVVAGLPSDYSNDYVVVATMNDRFEITQSVQIDKPNEWDGSMNFADLSVAPNGQIAVGWHYNYYEEGADTSYAIAAVTTFDLALTKQNEWLSKPNEQEQVINLVTLDTGSMVMTTTKNTWSENRDDIALVIRTFKPDATIIAEKSIGDPERDYGSGYSTGAVLSGNTFAMDVFGKWTTYNETLAEIATEKTTDSYGLTSDITLVDGSSIVSFYYDEYTRSIAKINSFVDEPLIEKAPRVIHTTPPEQFDIVGFAPGGKWYGGQGEGSGPGSLPIGDTYVSGYNNETKSVNPIYAGSLIMIGFNPYDDAIIDMVGIEFMDGMQGYRVGPTGKLEAIDMSVFDGLDTTLGEMVLFNNFTIFSPGEDLKTLKHISLSKKPDAAAPVDDSSKPSDSHVDPCYAGAFVFQLSTMSIHKVMDDGSLSFIPVDPYRANVGDFGYDIWKDELYYLYPDGEMTYYPETRPYDPGPA